MATMTLTSVVTVTVLIMTIIFQFIILDMGPLRDHAYDENKWIPYCRVFLTN